MNNKEACFSGCKEVDIMRFFDDSDWDKPVFEMLDKLDNRVKEYIVEAIEDELKQIFVLIDETESPIEQLLMVAMERKSKKLGVEHIILPQSEINCFGKKYRVDFEILIGDFLYDHAGCKKLVVECDGHNFHEKTKKQAARDKQRDRNLLAAGYQVMRFTGSEIWNDPNRCAQEIIDMIVKINSGKF